jgi:hypothetical protein
MRKKILWNFRKKNLAKWDLRTLTRTLTKIDLTAKGGLDLSLIYPLYIFDPVISCECLGDLRLLYLYQIL